MVVVKRCSKTVTDQSLAHSTFPAPALQTLYRPGLAITNAVEMIEPFDQPIVPDYGRGPPTLWQSNRRRLFSTSGTSSS